MTQYLTEDGSKIALGDKITVTITETYEDKEFTHIISIILDAKLAKKLTEEGALKPDVPVEMAKFERILQEYSHYSGVEVSKLRDSLYIAANVSAEAFYALLIYMNDLVEGATDIEYDEATIVTDVMYNYITKGK